MWTGVGEWMDTPQTVMTTRAPAVLKIPSVLMCGSFCQRVYQVGTLPLSLEWAPTFIVSYKLSGLDYANAGN